MLLVFEIALALGYTVLAHLASAWNDARFGALALADLALMLLLSPLCRRRAWAWCALPLLLAGVWALHRAGATQIPMLLVPVAFIALIAFWFARSLRRGRVPLITKIAAALDTSPGGTLEPEVERYTRGLTAIWAVLLGALAAVNLALALIAVPDGLLARLGFVAPVTVTQAQWSWFANLFNYGIVGGFFLIEYQVRKRRFPGRYRSFADFGRRMAALGPAFWRDFLS